MVLQSNLFAFLEFAFGLQVAFRHCCSVKWTGRGAWILFARSLDPISKPISRRVSKLSKQKMTAFSLSHAIVIKEFASNPIAKKPEFN